MATPSRASLPSAEPFTTSGVSRADALALPPGPAVRTVLQIAQAWALSRDQAMALVGVDSTTVWSGWKKEPDNARLKLHMVERISHVLGIYRALHTLFDEAFADAWVLAPNSGDLFRGAPPIERMTGFVVDLAEVHQRLDAEVHR